MEPGSSASLSVVTKERKAFAKALSQHGFAFDACMEALTECNNDMNKAAVYLVSRYGPPKKIVTSTASTVPPQPSTHKSSSSTVPAEDPAPKSNEPSTKVSSSSSSSSSTAMDTSFVSSSSSYSSASQLNTSSGTVVSSRSTGTRSDRTLQDNEAMDTTTIEEQEDNHSVYPHENDDDNNNKDPSIVRPSSTTTPRSSRTPSGHHPSVSSSAKKSVPPSSSTKAVPPLSSSFSFSSVKQPLSHATPLGNDTIDRTTMDQTPELLLGSTPSLGTETLPLTSTVTPIHTIPPELRSARRSAAEGSMGKILANNGSVTKGTPQSPVRPLTSLSSCSSSSSATDIDPMRIDEPNGDDEETPLLDTSFTVPSSSLASSALQQQDLLSAMDTIVQTHKKHHNPSASSTSAPTGRRESLAGNRTQDSLLKQLRHLSNLLEVCLGPIDAPGMVPRPTKESTEYVRSIPVTTVQQLFMSLQDYIQQGMNLRGILPINRNSGAPPAPFTLKEEQSIAATNITIIATAFEASLIALLIMSTPQIDGILISEDLLSAVIRLTRFHTFAHILPCYDALDPTWQRNPNETDDDDTMNEPTGTKGSTTLSSSSRKSTRTGSTAGKKFRYMSDMLDDEDNDDDNGDDTNDDNDHGNAMVPVKVTAAMLTLAQKRIRPLLLQMCHVIDRLQPIIVHIRLGEAMIEVVSELALVTATQTTAIPTRPPRRTLSRRKKTDTGNVTPLTTPGAESTLQGSSMVLLQCIFERYPDSRKYIINDLSMTHVRLTAGKRFVRDFLIASTLPRPHLPSGTPIDTTNNSNPGNVSVPSDTNSTVSIHSCTALILHLIHCSVTLPTVDEVKNAIVPSSVSTTTGGNHGTVPVIENKTDTGTNDDNTNGKNSKRGSKDSKASSAAKASTKSGTKKREKNAPSDTDDDETMMKDDDDNAKPVIIPTVTSTDTTPNPAAKPTVPVTEGYRTAVRLSQQYALNIFRWCEQKIRGETVLPPVSSGSLTVTTVPSFAEDEDPRIVLRRFVDDLCQIIDVPEWPGAELLLSQLLSFIVNKIKATSSAAAASGTMPTVTVTNADRTLSTLCVSLLSPIVVRLQACQSFARRHTLELPPPLPEPSDTDDEKEEMENSEMGCACNREAITGAFHVACDVCHNWFHGACVGIVDGELLEDDFWSCDDCCMRAQIRFQRDRSHQTLTSRSTDTLMLAEKKQYQEEKEEEEDIDMEANNSASRKKGKKGNTGNDGKDTTGEGRKNIPPVAVANNRTSETLTVRTPSTPMRKNGAKTKHPRTNNGEDEGNHSLDAYTVFQQLFLNYVTEISYDDIYARMARRFYVGKWASDALQARNDNLRLYYSSLWILSDRVLSKGKAPPVLSPYNTARLSLQILATASLVARVDRLFYFLLQGFDAGSSKTRAALTKTLSDLLKAEPALMENEAMARVVESLLDDESALVRSEAIDLLGRHILLSPRQLLPRYYKVIFRKLRDESIATRKRTVTIFKELLLGHHMDNVYHTTKSVNGNDPSSPTLALTQPVLLPSDTTQYTEVLRALLARANDRHEEESIKHLVTDTFQAIWFAMPTALPGTVNHRDEASIRALLEHGNTTQSSKPSSSSSSTRTDSSNGGSNGNVMNELRNRTAQILALVDVSISQGKTTDWLVDMVKAIIGPVPSHASPPVITETVDTKPKIRRSLSSSSALSVPTLPDGSSWSAIGVCTAMVDILIDTLLGLGVRRNLILEADMGVPNNPSTLTEDYSFTGNDDGGVRTNPTTPVGSPVRTGSGTHRNPSFNSELARRTYEREMKALTSTLFTFAQALPSAVGKHITVLVPYLKGDFLLSANSQTLLLQRIAGILEVTLPVVPSLHSNTLQTIETDLLSLITRSSTNDSVRQAVAAALGVLVTTVTEDPTRVRETAERMYAHVHGIRENCLATVHDQARKKGQRLPDDVAKVVWLREAVLTSTGTPSVTNGTAGSLAANFRAMLVSLISMGLLVRYCDLERYDPSDDKTTVSSSSHGSKNNSATKDNGKEKSVKMPNKAHTPVGSTHSSVPKASSGHKYGTGTVSPDTGAVFSTTSLSSSSSAALAKDHLLTSIYEITYAYAFASLELCKAARTRVLREQAMDAATDNTTATDKALVFLRDLKDIACKALRGLGYTCTRNPRFMLTESFRSLVLLACDHPLWHVRETILLLFKDLLTALDERAAVARALALRAQMDQRKFEALQASGYVPNENLLASAAGNAFKAASILQKVTKTTTTTTTTTDAQIIKSGSSLVTHSSSSGSGVMVTLNDGTVVTARREVVGDADSDANIFTAIVQDFYDQIRNLSSYEPLTIDIDAGIATEKYSGERVRLAASSLFTFIVRQGVTTPDSLVEPLMAMLADEHDDIKENGQAQLLELAEKYANKLELRAVAGIVESYRYQMRVYNHASIRVTSSLTGKLESLLGFFYNHCLARNPLMDSNAPLNRGRLNVLRKIILRIVPDEIPGLHGNTDNVMDILQMKSMQNDDDSVGSSNGLSFASSWAETSILPVRSSGMDKGMNVLTNLLKTPSSSLSSNSNSSGSGTKKPSAPTVPQRNSHSSSKPSSPNLPSPVLGNELVDVRLQRYLIQTLMFLPYEREEDILTVIAMINRQAALFSDALLSALSTFATAGSFHARHGGEATESSTLTMLQSKVPKKPVPDSGSTEYTLLSVHAAYAWALVCLLHAKVYLMTVYNLSDERVSRYDPDGAINRGTDRPAVPVYTLQTSELAVLPTIPSPILYALSGGKEGNTGLSFDEMDADLSGTHNTNSNVKDESTKKASIKRSLTSSLSSVDPRPTSNSRGLQGDVLHTIITELDTILTETANDFSVHLPNAMRRRGGAGKKGGNSSANKRKSIGGDDDGLLNHERKDDTVTDGGTRSSTKGTEKSTSKGETKSSSKKRRNAKDDDEDDNDDEGDADDDGQDDDDETNEIETKTPAIKGKNKRSKTESATKETTTAAPFVTSSNKRTPATKEESQGNSNSSSKGSSQKKSSARK